MKVNPLMSLKHFDCQRNAQNYINNSVLQVGCEEFTVNQAQSLAGR